jgi:hypothetical protein
MRVQRTWGWSAAVLAVVVAVAAPSGSARAGGASAATWTGTLTLNPYPCNTAPGCTGSFAGSLVGIMAGTDQQGKPFTVVWPDPTVVAPPPVNFTASFFYSEGCPLGQTGAASGSYTISGGYVDDGGVVSHDGTLTGSFDWLRVGLAVAVTTSSGVLTGSGKTLATQQVSPGVGTGVFVPTGGSMTCLSVGSLSAAVQGSYGSPQ